MAKQNPFVTEEPWWIRLGPCSKNLSLQPKVDESPETTGKFWFKIWPKSLSELD